MSILNRLGSAGNFSYWSFIWLMSKSRTENLSNTEIFRKATFSGKIALVLATWFSSGLVPFASGTSGTLAAIPLVFILNEFGILNNAVTVLIVLVVAIWSSDRTQDLLEKKDPSEIVIDEVAGFLLAMSLLPYTWLTLCLSFCLFRFFDVLKPYPIKRLEELNGGFGIVMDDLLAGLYACAGTWIVLFLLGYGNMEY